RHTRSYGDWSSDVCSSDLLAQPPEDVVRAHVQAIRVRLFGRDRRHIFQDRRRVRTDGLRRAERLGRLGETGRNGREGRDQRGGQIGRASCRERGWEGGGGV